jgi:hypothetical protein
LRRTLHLLTVGFLSVFSIQTIVSIIDWLGRWDWLETFMANHPRLAAYLHTPVSYLALLALGLGPLWAERLLKQPRLIAKLSNSRFVPDLTTTPMRLFLESQSKRPGWDKEKLNWEWFPEISVVNDSDNPTTIERVEVQAWTKRNWWSRKEKVAITQKQVDEYEIDLSIDENFKPLSCKGNHFRSIESLSDRINGIPLTRGIGFRGWLRFHVDQVSQADISRLKLETFLIDSLDGRHRVQHKKSDENRWDKNFHINLKTRATRPV